MDRYYCRFIHSVPFWREGHADCDLHWHVLPECCYEEADRAFWRGAEPVRIHGVETKTLNPTDQILHACVHGARWNEVPPLRWIADTIVILESAGHEVEWDRLVREAVEGRLVLPLREALGYLVKLLAAPVPATMLEELDNARVTLIQRMEYRVRTARPGLTGFLPEATLRHLTYYRGSRLSRLATLPRAYQYTWELESLWQVPQYAVFKSVGRAVRRLASRRAGSGTARR